jgi:hypothetical protein
MDPSRGIKLSRETMKKMLAYSDFWATMVTYFVMIYATNLPGDNDKPIRDVDPTTDITIDDHISYNLKILYTLINEKLGFPDDILLDMFRIFDKLNKFNIGNDIQEFVDKVTLSSSTSTLAVTTSKL